MGNAELLDGLGTKQPIRSGVNFIAHRFTNRIGEGRKGVEPRHNGSFGGVFGLIRYDVLRKMYGKPRTDREPTGFPPPSPLSQPQPSSPLRSTPRGTGDSGKPSEKAGIFPLYSVGFLTVCPPVPDVFPALSRGFPISAARGKTIRAARIPRENPGLFRRFSSDFCPNPQAPGVSLIVWENHRISSENVGKSRRVRV